MTNTDNPNIVSIKYCTIPAQIPVQIYHCYYEEECCKYGCCTKAPEHFYQTWYFWFTVWFVFLAIFATCWACKRTERATVQEQPRYFRETRPRVRMREFIMEVAGREAGESAEPPSYCDVVAKVEELSAPPPDYSSATAQQ